jgi:peptide deformylase
LLTKKLTPVIGLAAPQIGHSVSLIGLQVKDKQLLTENGMKEYPLNFMVNPKIVHESSDSMVEYEFCESIPHYSGLVRRAKTIKVEYMDIQGNQKKEQFDGLLSRIVQHEVDHLNGECYVDKIVPKSFRHDGYIGQYEVHSK